MNENNITTPENNQMIKSSEWDGLESALLERQIKTFRTKKEAQAHSKHLGWRNIDVLKIYRRFETVWIVGRVHSFERAKTHELWAPLGAYIDEFSLKRMKLLKTTFSGGFNSFSC